MMRIFVAIEISDYNTINSIKKFQSEFSIDAKPIESINLHFTLQFLGEISKDGIKKIISALHTIKFSSFNINLTRIGTFPNPKHPRIIWIGTDQYGRNMLIQLAKKVEKVLKPLELLPDKPFKPHITVFRIKKNIGDVTKKLEEQKMIDFGIQSVTSIKLKQSTLTPNGPIYSDLEEIKAIK